MLIKTKNGCSWYGEKITEAEYSEILSTLRKPPAAPEGYGYRLTEALEWERYELPAEDPDPELTGEEALSMILGGNGT